MKKVKRILSAILIAAMALSLMPTLASATVGETYTYHFNPTSVETTYTTTTHTFETTKAAGSDPWEYLGKYGLTSTHPIGKKWTNGNIDMYMSTSKDKHGYAAFKIQIPESGKYSATLFCTKYNASGSINMYLLPGDTVLNYDANDTFDSQYKLNNAEISLYSSSTAYAQAEPLDSIINISENEVGENGAEKILIIQSSSFLSGKLNNFIYIDSLTLTKTAEAEDDTTVKHTVTFNANNGTTDTATQSVVTETATTLTENSFTKEGYVFDGWNTAADGSGTAYADKAEVTLTTDLELYAQWKLAPITLRFDKSTVTVGDDKGFNTFSANDGQNFSFVSAKSSSKSGTSSSIQNYGLLMNNMRAGTTGKNWLSRVTDSTYMADESNDKHPARLTISANDIPAGTYKLTVGAHNFNRGAGVYFYVGDEYVGYDNAYASTGEFNDNIETPTDIGYVTIADSDNNSSTANPVEISICSAAVDYETNANLYVLKSISFTPVDAIPSYGELDCTVGGEAAEASYSVGNGDTLSVSAMLSGKHLNGYTLSGTEDEKNCIRVSSSDESIVSVTDTEAVLDSEAIYASGYKPVYTLTALKSNASATIKVEAIVDGKSVASKEFTVAVAKSDADTYEPSATFAWGTTLPSVLVADNVTVSEKDGEAVSAGEITASKGTTYVLSAAPEITDGETTYKFIGWKRGATSTGATAFIGYEAEDEYTVWSNTYITAEYEAVTANDEKRVEFYDQDGYYLGYMTETQFEEKGLPASPKLLGHTFSKWQYVDANGETKEFTDTTELTETVTRVVALQTPAKVTVTYKNENGETVAEETYDYDQEVNALTDSGISDATYWTILAGDAEKTVRTSNGYTFYAWANATLKGYTGAVTEKLPKVVLHDTPRDDSYMIEYDRYSGSYTVVEAGILLGDDEAISLLSCEKKYTSAKGARAHGQFAAPYDDYDYVRGYIIYKNNDAISVVYTDTIATKK